MASASRPRRVFWAAIAVIIAWLGVGGFGGPLIGKLSSVQQNQQLDFLPASAESTQVVTRSAPFNASSSLPLLVVVERASGLTTADRTAVAALAKSLPSLTLQLDAAHPLSDYLVSGQLTPVPSADGKAMLLVVPLSADKASATVGTTTPLDAATTAIRADLTPLRDSGLTAQVTGPAAFVADLVKAFAGIDGILLLVTLAVVLVILLVVYRSPLLPLVVLLSAVFGLSLAGGIVYGLAKSGAIRLSGQSQGILFILVVGAATDYALLLVSRFKEELHDTASTWEALRRAWLASVEPIAASGGTVALGLLCLQFAQLRSSKGLGPVGAIGIGGAMLGALTFLPALLLLGGRTLFWPVKPKLDHRHRADALSSRTGWGRVAGMVGAHPRRVWAVTLLILLAAGSFVLTFRASGVSTSDTFLTKVESVAGQQTLAKHFDAGSGSPVQVLAPASQLSQVTAAITATKGVAGPYAGAYPGAPATVKDGLVLVKATLSDPADSAAALDTVQRLRTAMHAISPDVLVGGSTAQSLDTRVAADRDNKVVMPAIIAVVFLVLALLLRSLVAAVLLILANLLSFAATLGVSAIAFNHVFHFVNADPATPLYGFVFLVALGVDYSIFLMTRAREETLSRAPRQGMLTALAVTGGVITSAGVVLAATFAALSVIPLLFMAEIAFIVAFGVLVDTLVVRSLLVPAVGVDLGFRLWWPGKAARQVHSAR